MCSAACSSWLLLKRTVVAPRYWFRQNAFSSEPTSFPLLGKLPVTTSLLGACELQPPVLLSGLLYFSRGLALQLVCALELHPRSSRPMCEARPYIWRGLGTIASPPEFMMTFMLAAWQSRHPASGWSCARLI